MRLDHLGETFHTVGPDTNGLISGTRDNLVAVRGHTNAVNCALVSHEAEWSHHRFKVPDHNSAIERSWDNLAQVWIETCGRDSIFMAFEWAFHGGVGRGTTRKCTSLSCSGLSRRRTHRGTLRGVVCWLHDFLNFSFYFKKELISKN